MTGRQRSSTSVVPDQFSQWSNTFRHRACSTAALHCSTAVCTQRRNLIAISVSTGAVYGAMGVCSGCSSRSIAPSVITNLHVDLQF